MTDDESSVGRVTFGGPDALEMCCRSLERQVGQLTALEMAARAVVGDMGKSGPVDPEADYILMDARPLLALAVLLKEMGAACS